jgi:pimeloyl-ACP methyl ester carboxylesterase
MEGIRSLSWGLIFLLVGVLHIKPASASNVCVFESGLINTLRSAVNDDYTSLASAPNPGVPYERIYRNAAPQLYAIKLNASPVSHGLFVVFQGDGFAAERMAVDLAPLASKGFTVVVQDYRGLGKSTGTPSFRSSIDDATTWIEELRADQTNESQPIVYYGTSFGGVVLLSALREVRSNEVVVLDGVPDNLPALLLCSHKFYPTTSIEAIHGIDALKTRLIVISSANDKKAGPAMMAGLLKFAQRTGATAMVVRQLAHPFEPNDDVASRLATILSVIMPALPQTTPRNADGN